MHTQTNVDVLVAFFFLTRKTHARLYLQGSICHVSLRFEVEVGGASVEML